MNHEEIILKAIEFATEAHKGQKRKDGKDYITHPMAAMEIARGILRDKWDFSLDNILRISIITLFHDFEDTIWNGREAEAIEEFDRRYSVFNNFLYMKGDILSALIILNKHNHKNYFEYIMAAKQHKWASIGKLADLKHNMSDLQEGSLKDKYRLAEYILTN